ncbi:DUF1294 domain-containing protein [Zobellella aerophila]|uniref:DUF1294 domain-containing protein n=1 Tax=Zobellella aerophila TaxID=870480 RepID=A0ABP6WK81_9GAMM
MIRVYVGLALWYLVLSLITFGVYWWDKRAAIHGRWRVRERSLHLLAALGGWPGGWLARHLLRHKSRKPSFRLVFWLTVLANLTLPAALWWGRWG